MGTFASAELDDWLRAGGIVVAASDRAARAATAAFNAARRAEGLTAWPAPRIFDWRVFVRDAWSARALDDRFLLNDAQEQSLWEEIAKASRQPATVLDHPRTRVAALAADAHELLALHAPRYLRATLRRAWQQDAAAFSGWLSAFDDACRRQNALSAARIPIELVDLLAREDAASRAPLLLTGFDRILPAQRSVFDAWGAWREAARSQPAGSVHYYAVPDEAAELAACALWCAAKLRSNAGARILIVTQKAADRRGPVERALLRHALPAAQAAPAPLFEFSLGLPLASVSIVRAAVLLLRWLTGPLDEADLDWLFASGYLAQAPGESAALLHAMRQIRRRNLQRVTWMLESFPAVARDLPRAWLERMLTAQRLLAEQSHRALSPVDWASLIPRLLRAAGWPGHRQLSSAEFQAADRWQQAIDLCGSLAFDGRRVRWPEFLAALSRTLDETLFAPESQDAPILIAGPAESAGMAADQIWFLGADEETWPSGGSMHPFLPPHVQREGAMPHASPQLDWDLARSITVRLIASAPEVCFSYARQTSKSDARASRLIAQLASPAIDAPASLRPAADPAPAAIDFLDSSLIPFPRDFVEGGAAILSAQSQCPFQAFARARLEARGWESAQAALTPAQRGRLIHETMHSIWAGEDPRIRTLDDLRQLADLGAFVAGHVQRALQVVLSSADRDRMPRRYLDLEESRLRRLVHAWLSYERARHAFTVLGTEVQGNAIIAGLSLRLRSDRVDRLNDNSLLVIDYKTGDVSSSAWNLPRPDDVQLPLYAAFTLPERETCGGLVFAKVRAGDGNMEFSGRVRSASAALLPGLNARSGLAKFPLKEVHLLDWRTTIEELARDFLRGNAIADPKAYPDTCERCGLQALCRIDENRRAGDDATGDSDGEAPRNE